jgi:hypothetical protein
VTRAALLALSHDDLIDLILAQHARIEAQAGQITALTARVTELEARCRWRPGSASIWRSSLGAWPWSDLRQRGLARGLGLRPG